MVGSAAERVQTRQKTRSMIKATSGVGAPKPSAKTPKPKPSRPGRTVALAPPASRDAACIVPCTCSQSLLR